MKRLEAKNTLRCNDFLRDAERSTEFENRVRIIWGTGGPEFKSRRSDHAAYPPVIGNPRAVQRYGDAARRTSSMTPAANSSTACHAVYSIHVFGSVGPPVSSMMKRIIQRSRQP